MLLKKVVLFRNTPNPGGICGKGPALISSIRMLNCKIKGSIELKIISYEKDGAKDELGTLVYGAGSG